AGSTSRSAEPAVGRRLADAAGIVIDGEASMRDQSRFRAPAAVFSMALTAAMPRVASACNADLREAITGQPIGSSDVSSAANFYDDGALFMDADSADTACRGAARDRLDQKLSLELGRSNAFTEWLAGGDGYPCMADAP